SPGKSGSPLVRGQRSFATSARLRPALLCDQRSFATSSFAISTRLQSDCVCALAPFPTGGASFPTDEELKILIIHSLLATACLWFILVLSGCYGRRFSHRISKEMGTESDSCG